VASSILTKSQVLVKVCRRQCPRDIACSLSQKNL